MEQDIRNLFKNTNQNTNQNTKIGLSDDIWFAICKHQTRLNKRATLSYLSLSIFSFVGLVLAAKDFIVEFGRSGFSQYFLSIFSDARLVTTYWKELLLSLADSLPILSI